MNLADAAEEAEEAEEVEEEGDNAGEEEEPDVCHKFFYCCTVYYTFFFKLNVISSNCHSVFYIIAEHTS